MLNSNKVVLTQGIPERAPAILRQLLRPTHHSANCPYFHGAYLTSTAKGASDKKLSMLAKTSLVKYLVRKYKFITLGGNWQRQHHVRVVTLFNEPALQMMNIV